MKRKSYILTLILTLAGLFITISLCYFMQIFSPAVPVKAKIQTVTITDPDEQTSQTKSAGSTYHILEKADRLYMKDKNEKNTSGWFIKVGEDYRRLGSVEDLGIYKRKKFKILFADDNGRIATDKTIREEFPFNENGVLVQISGLYHIRGNYYFIKNGKLQTQDGKYGKVKYYIRLNGTVYSYKEEGEMYSPAGDKLSYTSRRDIRARLCARDIITKITKKSMSKKEKLQACFQWVVHNYSYVEVGCRGEKGWTSKSGLLMLQRGIGDCRVLAVGFAYLASELGYEDTYFCQDSKNVFSGSHCWTSVNGKYYDPLFYNSKRPERYMAVFNGSTPEAYREKTHCTASQKFKPGE